ncbi:MAG: MFS transporter [Candidatus Weimeria sp.]
MLLFIIYLAFISLGLPDSLLGSAWPTIYRQFDVPVSYMGFVSMIISFCTIISALMSDRLTKKLGTGKITALSTALTAVGLFGFSFSSRYYMLCLWALPYGLGAGSIDAALNNFVALHFKSRHMSWLHCMWGIGASFGPYVMSYCITDHDSWNMGYRVIGFIQSALTLVIIISLPLWNRRSEADGTDDGAKASNRRALSIKEILAIPGAKEILITFFCYCAVEQTAGQWAASYLTVFKGVPAATAASFASLFYIGITIGRAASGFLTFKLNDTQMIHLGQGVIALGIILLFLPFGDIVSLAGLIIVGLGCAPVYPSIIHSTPYRFGADKSQAIIGVQMAFAYIGTTLMPPLFGLLANHISFALFPFYLGIILVLMIVMYMNVIRKTEPAVLK